MILNCEVRAHLTHKCCRMKQLTNIYEELKKIISKMQQTIRQVDPWTLITGGKLINLKIDC